jgi:hypothetical protein
LVSETVDVAFLSGNQTLQAIWARSEAVDSTEELRLVSNARVSSVHCNLEDLTITAANDNLISGHGLDTADS